jgi:hypothetical protein
MTDALRSAIVELATRFADDVLELVSAAVVEEVTRAGGVVRDGRRRRVRRSEEQLRAVGDRILAVLRRKPGGLRAEDLRGELGLAREQMGRPLRALLDGGQVKKSGERRLTVYRAADAAPSRPRAKGTAAPPS